MLTENHLTFSTQRSALLNSRTGHRLHAKPAMPIVHTVCCTFTYMPGMERRDPPLV